jgi:hypothetical protein
MNSLTTNLYIPWHKQNMEGQLAGIWIGFPAIYQLSDIPCCVYAKLHRDIG